MLVFLLSVLMSSLSIEAMADIFNEDEDGESFHFNWWFLLRICHSEGLSVVSFHRY